MLALQQTKLFSYQKMQLKLKESKSLDSVVKYIRYHPLTLGNKLRDRTDIRVYECRLNKHPFLLSYHYSPETVTFLQICALVI